MTHSKFTIIFILMQKFIFQFLYLRDEIILETIKKKKLSVITIRQSK